jgi:methionyl-tRNA formyltransferase
LPELFASEQIEIAGVIVAGPPPRNWRMVRRKFRKLLRTGISGALNGIRMRSWYHATTTDIRDICGAWQIPYFEVQNVNCQETERLFRELSPDLGLSLGNSYIAERVYSLPKFGMINLHGEKLPDYQNAQSVIWPIFNQETKTGFSIHQIDKGIDTGDILYREEVGISFQPLISATVRETAAITRKRFPKALRYVCENYDRLRENAIMQQRGLVYTTPTIFQFVRMTWNNWQYYRILHGVPMLQKEQITDE